MKYVKEIFYPTSLQHAKRVVLTPSGDDPEKFELETNFFINFLVDKKLINSNTTVLDFGCGMGRVSKAIIQKFGCKVIGTDFSERMRAFAILYVRDPIHFDAHPVHTEQNIDVAVATFVLQHVEHPEQEIRLLHSVIKQNGHLVLVNEAHRLVPSDVWNGFIVWKDDKVNIHELVAKYFDPIGRYPYYNGMEMLSIWKPKVDILI